MQGYSFAMSVGEAEGVATSTPTYTGALLAATDGPPAPGVLSGGSADGDNEATIDLIESLCLESFPPGMLFSSASVLKAEIKAIGDKYGFALAGTGRQITCSRYGTTRVKKEYNEEESDRKRPRQAVNSLKCNCGFACNWAYVINTFPHPDNQFETTTAAQHRTTPELQQVKIMPSSCYRHSNGCTPSYGQYHFQVKKAGKLFLKESEKMDDLLCMLERTHWKMDNQTLRAYLGMINPTQSYITADELRNFRMWAKKESVKRASSGKKVSLTQHDMTVMFSDVITKPDSSIAVEQAEEVYRLLLQNTMENGNNTWRVEQYLTSLRDKDPTFDFRIARDKKTGAATMVVWQTGTMRADFELYGCALHLDFMKRKMNSYDWPYISVVGPDSAMSPRVFVEGIACTERHAAYVAGVNALFVMSPGRKKAEVFAVFADGVMGKSILSKENMDLPNANFISDCLHLTKDIWPKLFGGNWCENLSSGLSSMMYANSEEAFEQALSNLQVSYAGNANVLNNVNKIAGEREHYAKYILDTYPGTCGKISNNPAEQNHSSIVAHLGGAMYEEPSVEIMRLIARQRDSEKKRNQEKSAYFFSLPVEIDRSEELRSDPFRREAKEKLDKRSSELWNSEYTLSFNYTCSVDHLTGQRTFTNMMYPNSPRVLEKGERCTCTVCVQNLIQCRHEIAEQPAERKLCIELIDKRHLFYKQVHTKVNRNSNIAGNSFASEGAVEIESARACAAPSLPLTGQATGGYTPASDLASAATSTLTVKPIRKVDYLDITKITNEFASLAIQRGQETARMAYGVAIQLENAMRTNGDLHAGTLEDIINSYQHTFNGMTTSAVTFTLSTGGGTSGIVPPPLPPSKPGSRVTESRMKSKIMEAAKGAETTKRCTFCREKKHMITSCQKKISLGVHLKSSSRNKQQVDEISLLHKYIETVKTSASYITHYSMWPSDLPQALHMGVPSDAMHIIVHGFHQFQLKQGPAIAVAAVQFLMSGGKDMESYKYVAMSLTELTRVLYQTFSVTSKCVLVNKDLYGAIIA